MHILRFKNIACIHCNLGSNFNDSSLTCGHFELTGNTKMHSFSLILNLRNTDVIRNIEKSLSELQDSYTYGAVIEMPKTNICPSGYIAVLVRDFCFISHMHTKHNIDSTLQAGSQIRPCHKIGHGQPRDIICIQLLSSSPQ